ncbi:MAG TPA: ion transporter [Chryseosolibacter sp.]|nr:ion transporter [Chryseosolibacter sp.]
MATFRKKVFNLLEPSISGSKGAKFIEWFLIVLIFANIISIILESVKDINAVYGEFFRNLEFFSIAIFSIEYFLRIWTSVENPKYNFSRKKYIFSGMAIIDLLSILPSHLDVILGYIPVDLLFLRMFRLMRLFRLLKIARYLKALNIMQAVLKERREQLLVSIMFILFLLVIVSTMMFYIENEAQPQQFSSIPATMWWGIATLTTVGYGDMIPLTPIGKMLGGMIAILGIGLFALPAGIFSSGLTEHMYGGRTKNNLPIKRCPHCGEDLASHPQKDIPEETAKHD